MGWTTEITLKNKTNRDFECKIPKGQVFENKQIGSGKQNVAAAREYVFNVPANLTISVEIEVLCINEHLSSPSGSYNVTYFKVDKDFNNQRELWSIMKPQK